MQKLVIKTTKVKWTPDPMFGLNYLCNVAIA